MRRGVGLGSPVGSVGPTGALGPEQGLEVTPLNACLLQKEHVREKVLAGTKGRESGRDERRGGGGWAASEPEADADGRAGVWR